MNIKWLWVGLVALVFIVVIATAWSGSDELQKLPKPTGTTQQN